MSYVLDTNILDAWHVREKKKKKLDEASQTKVYTTYHMYMLPVTLKVHLQIEHIHL